MIRILYSILIYVREWPNVHVIHWNKLLNHIGKKFPRFNFLECCSLSTPKRWKSKGNSDYNRTRAEALTRSFNVQLSHTSFKSLSFKPPGHTRLTACAGQAICTYGLLVCLVLSKHMPTLINPFANTFLMDICISISIMDVLKPKKGPSSSLNKSGFEVEQQKKRKSRWCNYSMTSVVMKFSTVLSLCCV